IFLTVILLSGASLLKAESIHETATRYPSDQGSLYDPTPVPEYPEYPPQTTEAPRYPQPQYPAPQPQYPAPQPQYPAPQPKYPTTPRPTYPTTQAPKYSPPEPKYNQPKYPQPPPKYPIRYEQAKPEYGYVQGYKLAFVAILSVLALAAADQSSHQTIKHGNAPAVHSSIHKPHGGSHAHVVSQPSAQPNEVNQAYNEEKYTAAAHAPSHEVRTPAYHTPAFVAILSVLALAAADQSSHQTIKHGNAPAVHSSIHKPHGGSHAHVVSQPSAQPNEVNQAYNEEKYTAAAHAPSHEVRTPAYHPTPSYKPAPYHPAPAYKPPLSPCSRLQTCTLQTHSFLQARPCLQARSIPPCPSYKPAPYHPAPAHGLGDEYETAPVYQYGYAVADDYSGGNFAQNENGDNYATNGEYRCVPFPMVAPKL
ncbi:hypothetical protein TCAL_10119, partial [Tigriopus californicus]